MWRSRSKSVDRTAQGRADAPSVGAGSQRRPLARRPPSCFAVVVEEPVFEPCESARAVDVHPHRNGVDDGCIAHGETGAPLGPVTAGAAAERRELDVLAVTREADDRQRGPAQHPGAFDAGVVDVVARHVLEIARHRVEPQPVRRVHVAEPYPARAREPATLLGQRYEFGLHRAPPRAEESVRTLSRGLVVVPATTELLGSANWWLPRWLGRILPEIRIEEGAPPPPAGGR
jgi:hypothetical protein